MWSASARALRDRRDAAWLALSWLTVVPLPHPTFTVDRRHGVRAITMTPLVGLMVGAVTVAVARGLSQTHLPEIAVGALAVGAAALLTRGMHLDGLADTADGLGCYGPPERAREVMRGGSVGPFGAATLVLVLMTQSALVGAVAGSGHWFAVIVGAVAGRWAAVICCRRGTPALVGGFGQLVADSQRWSILAWSVVVLAVAIAADPQRWWRGVAATVAVALVAVVLSRHCARRFGGVNGDVLGAAIELCATVALVAYSV